MDDFNAWEDEYQEVKEKASRAINAIKSNPGQLSQHQRTVESALTDAASYIKNMEKSASGAGPSDKKTIQTKCRQYKQEVGSIRTQLEEAKRGGLFAGAGATGNPVSGGGSAADRARIQNNTKRLDNTTDALQQAVQTVAQTEEIAVDTMGQMYSQREQLQNAQQKVVETREHTNEARQVLRNMGLRAIRTKAILIFVIILLIGAICAVIYVDFIKK